MDGRNQNSTKQLKIQQIKLTSENTSHSTKKEHTEITYSFKHILFF